MAAFFMSRSAIYCQEIKAAHAAPYTAKSEKTKRELEKQMKDAEAAAAEKPEAPEDAAGKPRPAAQPAAAPSKPRKPKSGKMKQKAEKEKNSFKDLLDHLPVDEVITQPMNPPSCDVCGSTMGFLKYEEHRELVVKPAEIYVRVTKTPIYVCRNYDRNGTVVPIVHQNAGFLRPLPRVQAAPETLAWLHYEKSMLGVPFYRLEEMFRDLGISLSRTTMNNWMIGSSERWLSIMAACIEQELLKQPVIHHDETPFQVLKEPERSP